MPLKAKISPGPRLFLTCKGVKVRGGDLGTSETLLSVEVGGRFVRFRVRGWERLIMDDYWVRRWGNATLIDTVVLVIRSQLIDVAVTPS